METPVYDPAVDRPSEVAHRAGPGELARVFADMEIVHYEETPSWQRRKRAICRMVAFRSPPA